MTTETNAQETMETTVATSSQILTGGTVPKSFYLNTAILLGIISIISLIIAIIKKRKNDHPLILTVLIWSITIVCLTFATLSPIGYIL